MKLKNIKYEIIENLYSPHYGKIIENKYIKCYAHDNSEINIEL